MDNISEEIDIVKLNAKTKEMAIHEQVFRDENDKIIVETEVM